MGPGVPTRLSVLLDAATTGPDWVIAGLCEMHPTALSLYRHGKRAIPNKHAQALASHLGVGLDDIRGQADEAWLRDLLDRQNA